VLLLNTFSSSHRHLLLVSSLQIALHAVVVRLCVCRTDNRQVVHLLVIIIIIIALTVVLLLLLLLPVVVVGRPLTMRT
jgi:hypothetical protein